MVDWNEVIRHEGPAVWRIAYRLLRNEADADECFQETFLAAFEVWNRQPVRNWPALLHRLATSRAIDRIRKQVRRRQTEVPADFTLAASTAGDPVDHAEANELAGALRYAVGQLPERQAEVFCLHELSAWSHQQIAEQLGITANAVGVILHRARQKLAELLNIQDRLTVALKRQQLDPGAEP
jgi:RNA polymerase sigma-70 factor (ECF subfamily)